MRTRRVGPGCIGAECVQRIVCHEAAPDENPECIDGFAGIAAADRLMQRLEEAGSGGLEHGKDLLFAFAEGLGEWTLLREERKLVGKEECDATVAFAYALIDLASLSFLGLAVQPPEADWGVLASDRDAMLQGHSTQVISASVLVVVTVLALFVLGARLAGERPTVRGRIPARGGAG